MCNRKLYILPVASQIQPIGYYTQLHLPKRQIVFYFSDCVYILQKNGPRCLQCAIRNCIFYPQPPRFSPQDIIHNYTYHRDKLYFVLVIVYIFCRRMDPGVYNVQQKTVYFTRSLLDLAHRILYTTTLTIETNCHVSHSRHSYKCTQFSVHI